MMCRVVDVQNDGIKYIITVEDNSGNKWEFFDSEDYWKKDNKMTCVFDYCETCETLFPSPCGDKLQCCRLSVCPVCGKFPSLRGDKLQY